MFRAKQKMTPRKASRGLRKVSAARRLHHTGRSLVAKRYWRIRGYKKFDQFFDETIPFGSLTEDQLKQLLKCLAAKGGLSYAEIIGVYVKRKTKLAHDILQIQKNGPYHEYSCGHDPSFVAIVVDDEGKRWSPWVANERERS